MCFPNMPGELGFSYRKLTKVLLSIVFLPWFSDSVALALIFLKILNYYIDVYFHFIKTLRIGFLCFIGYVISENLLLLSSFFILNLLPTLEEILAGIKSRKES